MTAWSSVVQEENFGRSASGHSPALCVRARVWRPTIPDRLQCCPRRWARSTCFGGRPFPDRLQSAPVPDRVGREFWRPTIPRPATILRGVMHGRLAFWRPTIPRPATIADLHARSRLEFGGRPFPDRLQCSSLFAVTAAVLAADHSQTGYNEIATALVDRYVLAADHSQTGYNGRWSAIRIVPVLAADHSQTGYNGGARAFVPQVVLAADHSQTGYNPKRSANANPPVLAAEPFPDRLQFRQRLDALPAPFWRPTIPRPATIHPARGRDAGRFGGRPFPDRLQLVLSVANADTVLAADHSQTGYNLTGDFPGHVLFWRPTIPRPATIGGQFGNRGGEFWRPTIPRPATMTVARTQIQTTFWRPTIPRPATMRWHDTWQAAQFWRPTIPRPATILEVGQQIVLRFGGRPFPDRLQYPAPILG